MNYDGNLKGKVVRMKNLQLLEFMYPDFIIKEKLFFDNDNKIIYTGKYVNNIKEYLSKNTKEFICTVGPYEIDLDDKEMLIDFVYSKWGKEIKPDVKELLLGQSDEDFSNYIKTYWLIGKSKLDAVDVTIFDLYKALGKSKSELLKVYFRLLEFYDINMIESSLITFIDKAMRYEEVNASGSYLLLLSDFKKKNAGKIKGILLSYTVMEDIKESKVLWLLMNL